MFTFSLQKQVFNTGGDNFHTYLAVTDASKDAGTMRISINLTHILVRSYKKRSGYQA